MKRLDMAIALILGSFAAYWPAPASAQETISFPSRSSDLAADSYWTVTEFSEGCCTLDLNVRRWNGDSWSGGGSGENAQNYDWSLPLYAPANGAVISCWRNFPDDPQPGVNPPNNNIFTGGNHVSILTDQGNVISLAHLKSGSIPAEFCPRNAGSTQYPSTLDKEGDWRVAAYVEPADRPRVREGQMIGRVGNSGHSGGPHLHMSIQEVQGVDGNGREQLGNSLPLPFRNSWAHPYEADQAVASASWFRQRGEGTSGDPLCATYQSDSPECGFRHIHASPYLRRANAAADGIKAGGDVFFLGATRAVTATVADPGDHLKLIAWDLVGVDVWNRRGDIEGEAIKKVVLTQPTADYLLAALHLANDTLKMVAYHVGPFGSFTEVADYPAGSIEELEALTVGTTDKMTVTAVRLANGNLKLIAWDVEVAINGSASVSRLGEYTSSQASHIAVAPARAFGGFYTALRNSSDNLVVIPFSLSSNGLTFTRGGYITSGAAGTEIAVAALAQGVAVAMRNADGNLQIKTFAASGDDVGSLRNTWIAGAVTEVAMLTTPLGESNLTTVVKATAEDKVMLIGWGVDADGGNLRRLGSSETTGTGSGIAADSVYRTYPGKDPRDMIATLMADSDGDLLLTAWDTNLVNP